MTPSIVPIVLPGVKFIQARFRNKKGQVEEWDYAEASDQNGVFYLPRSWAAGRKGEFALHYENEKGGFRQVVIDIETSREVPPKKVVGTVGSRGDGVLHFTDADQIVLTPQSVNGVGYDLLGEAVYTAPKTGVRVRAETSEGEIARGVRLINIHTGEESFEQTPTGRNDIFLDFPAGTFHIIPDWPRFMDIWIMERQSRGGKG